MARRLIIMAPLALFALFVAVVLFGLARTDRDVIRSAMVGKPLPEFDLPGLDPENPGLATADLRQGTVTLVNLFASWCLPCQAEAPQLEALERRGVVIHAIAVRDQPQAVTGFLQRYGDPFRRIGLDPQGRLQIDLGSSGVPETFVVDGSGIIRHQHIGVIRPEDVPRLLEAVAEARTK
jgi:cytochrome c biogenesis protein CcmG/thiol:disulfide interchange protein DsbE